MLFWSLAAFCALNFILMIYRCVTGVDFEPEFNNDLEDGAGIESAGPSNNSTQDSMNEHVQLETIDMKHESTPAVERKTDRK